MPASTDPELPPDDRPCRQGDRLGAARSRASRPTSRSSSTSRRAPRTRRTTSPKEWIEKFKGKFDMGWDEYREETLARQKKLGVVPQTPKLTARSEGPAGLGLAQRRPEAALRPDDGSLRRLTAHTATTRWAASSMPCKQLPDADNTLIIYIVGDNGVERRRRPRRLAQREPVLQRRSRRSGRTTSRPSTSSAGRSTSTTSRPPGRRR